MTKAKIVDERSELNVLRERVFLAKMHSPFIVNMLCSFQNKFNLFIVMELLTGGDLRFHLLNYSFFFSETQLKFLLSNIILGLEYIHKKGIMHRDIKPENIMLNAEGYLKVSDFGIACLKKKMDRNDDSGTPVYMAPETIRKKKEQDYSVDFYSLGVIGYEIMKGNVPYESSHRRIIKKMMKNNVINLTPKDKLKTNYSKYCLDFINKLLRTNPKERLGSKNGEQELKAHPFFYGLDWEKIEKAQFKSPIYEIIRFSRMKYGNTKELFDFEYCNREDEITPEKAKLYIEITNEEGYKCFFRYFTCVCVENIFNELKKDEKGKKNYKKLKKSQSMDEINLDYKLSDRRRQDDMYNQRYNFNLPNINNNRTEIFFKNQAKDFKNYYENQLFNYQDYLKNIYKPYEQRISQLNKMKYPSLYPKSTQLPQINNYALWPNLNQNLEQDKLPMISQNYNKYMNKMMSKYLNQMGEDKNNFFVQNNMNSLFNSNNNNYIKRYDNYLNDLNNEQGKYNNNFNNAFNFNNNPFMNNYNNINNPFWNLQNMGENQVISERNQNMRRYPTKRRSKMVINDEESDEEKKEDEK